MNELLQNPAVQAGVAPLVVALAVGLVLHGTRFAWLAIVAGYATFVALGAGFQFDPLTAGRKIVLLALLAPLVGLAVDRTAGGRGVLVAVALAAGAAAVWTFLSVLSQREGMQALVPAAGLAVFTVALVALFLRMRDDGLRTGAAGVALGVAAGIAALLSASIGFFMSGIAIAAASGALLLAQFARGPVAAGALGALSIAVPLALVASGSLMLAQLPWYALAAMLVVPAFALWPAAATGGSFRRALVIGLPALAAAAVPILAAWFAARGSPS
jgi:hypothetical protein